MPDFLEQLREGVYHDIMACIGCNDCLLACPLPESKLVTIAELNQAALAERITDPNVEAFVTQCTQCQQCVPVCPADLRRADIVLWNQIKIERWQPDRPVPLQAGERIVDSEWSVEELTRRLAALPLLDGVDPLAIRSSLMSVTLRRLAPGEDLVGEGQYYERLLVVLDGSLEQTAESPDGMRTRILVFGPGTFHGYSGVLGGMQEPFTISAIGETTIVEFIKATVLRLMDQSAAFRTTMEAIYRDNAVGTIARSSPLLAALPGGEVEGLLDQAALRVFRPGEVIYREGEAASFIYIVRSGFLRVARRYGADERVLQYYRDGDVFGAAAVLFDQLQTATVSASTRAEVVAIPGEAIASVLSRHPHLRQQLAASAATERVLDHLAQHPRSRGRPTENLMSLEGLVDDGIIQGHEVLVINTAICTNCNNCVDACERRHGHSRLDRSGLQMADLLFPTACRHCEDPVCLLCSVSGIVRDPDGEIRIVPDNCIGCGACAERCPYGNINMHPREKGRGLGIGEKLLGIFTGIGDEDIHHAGIKGDRVAVKCDLCAGYEDYACVTACPVGAAMRVNPVEMFDRSDVLVGLESKKPRETQAQIRVVP